MIFNKEKSNIRHIIKEIDILRICNHINIIKYIQHYEDMNKYYVVTEKVEEYTLPLYLYNNSKNMSKELKMDLINQIGIVHRNMIP